MVDDFAFFTKEEGKHLISNIWPKANLLTRAKIKAFHLWYLDQCRIKEDDALVNLLDFTDEAMHQQQHLKRNKKLTYESRAPSFLKETMKVPDNFMGKCKD